MSSIGLFINEYSFFSHPYFDEVLGGRTLAYSWPEDKKYRLNITSYTILKFVTENPGTNVAAITNHLISMGLAKNNPTAVEDVVSRFVDFAVSKEIVYFEQT